jgi:flavin reductase (DIM6/NTAB) family NADH-FMN oxidoreductase RutF
MYFLKLIDGVSMEKKRIRNGVYLYPMPVVLVGAEIEGKPNFMPIAWVSIVEHKPPMISISANQSHYTNKGIKENHTFSINAVSEEMVIIADYCGLKSGKDTDKSTIFEVFYGELKKTPMIKHSPLNLECEVRQTIDTKAGHDIFIGEVIASYAKEEILTKGIPDVSKLKPLIFSMNDNNYWKLGPHIGRAWSIGNNFNKNK